MSGMPPTEKTAPVKLNPKTGTDGGENSKTKARKRFAIAAKAIEDAIDIEVNSIPKPDAVYKLLEYAVKGNLLFKGLSLPA